jgi:hypothetical protein
VVDGNRLSRDRKLKPHQNDDDIPVLFRDSSGNSVRCWSAYYNEPSSRYSISINRSGLYVNFNPSKIVNGATADPLTDMVKVANVSKDVARRVNEFGVKFNLADAEVSRADLAKNKRLKPISVYRPAFEIMRGKRMKEAMYKDGYRMGNKHNQAVFYDKSAEARLEEKNIIRCEPRFLTKQAVMRTLGVRTFTDFCKMDNQHIDTTYRDFLMGNVFSITRAGEQLQMDYQNNVELLKHLKSAGKNSVMRWLLVIGIFEIIEKHGSVQVIFDIMRDAGFTRQAIDNNRKMIYELCSMSNATNKVTVTSLMNELYTAFAA